MNLNDLQAKHDKAVADLNTAAQELGKAKLGAAISLIRRVYTEAPDGSAASVDIMQMVNDIYLVNAVRRGVTLADAYGVAVAGPQASVTAQTIANMQTAVSTHGVSTRPVEPAIPRAEVCATADAQAEANVDAFEQAGENGSKLYEYVLHKDFGPGLSPKAGISAVPQVDTLQKWAIRVPADGSYSSIALVHIPTGAVTEGLPDMKAVCKYIEGRHHTGAAHWTSKENNGSMVREYDADLYTRYA